MKENIKTSGQYLGHDVEEENIPWMDYLLKMNQGNQGAPPIPDVPSDGQTGKNLLDGVNDPRSKSGPQGIQPVNLNDSLRKDEGSNLMPAEFNWHVIDEDPSLAMFRKMRSRQDDATSNPWDMTGLMGTGPGTGIVAGVRVASQKNIQDILASSTHPDTGKNKEAGKGLTPKNVSLKEDSDKGLYSFTVSGEGTDYTVKVQFLKDDSVDNLVEHPCLVACSCPHFLYGGPQYYAVRGRYMFMPMFRPQLREPREVSDGGKGKGLTFCKHLYAVAAHIGDLVGDTSYMQGVRKNLLGIKDPEFTDKGTLDSEQLSEEFHLDRKTRFVQLLETPALHEKIYSQARKQLRDRGLDEHMVHDYVTGPFMDSPKEVQEGLIRALAKTPDTIIMILLEYNKAFKALPGYLTDIAYKTIKTAIGG